MSKHVRIEVDGRTIIDDSVDDVEIRRMAVDAGADRTGFRVRKPTRKIILTYKERHDGREQQ